MQAGRGLQLWVDAVNAAGGLAVRRGDPPARLALVIHDDESRVASAAALTERLIVDEHVDLLFSPYSSVLTLAAAEVAERHGRVLWNHGGSTDSIAERGWRRVVNLLSPASCYFAGVLEYARAVEPSARTAALISGARGTFPAAVAAGAEAHAARLGFEMVMRATYPEAPHSHFAGLVGEVAARRPDVILGVGTTEADLAFAQEIRRQGVEAALIGLVATPIQRFRETLGADADGFCGPSQWEVTSRARPDLGPTSAAFAAQFRARYGIEPDYPAAQAYAAGLVAGRCVEVAGKLEQGALRMAAGALDLATFYGGFRLDGETGQQIGHDLLVVRWQAGRKVVVWPPAP